MDNSATIVFLVILFALVVGAVTLIIVLSVINAKYRRFVQNNSVSLKELSELNKSYHFLKIKNFDMSHSYDNENFYNNISCRDYLTYQLVYEQRAVSKALKDTMLNKTAYDEYRQKVSDIMKFGNYDTDIGKLKLKKLIRFEDKLFQEESLKPQIKFSILVTLHLTNINGQRKRRKSNRFVASEVKEVITKLNQKRGDYYTNREIWDAICRVERGKVTNKMRFYIYSRDGYRCRRCGRKTKDLEIDHIYPIAKGGKSTMDNLQTLCHRCNVRKGDSV